MTREWTRGDSEYEEEVAMVVLLVATASVQEEQQSNHFLPRRRGMQISKACEYIVLGCIVGLFGASPVTTHDHHQSTRINE